MAPCLSVNAWGLMSDACNIIAGVTLTMSFMCILLQYSFPDSGIIAPGSGAEAFEIANMKIEGFFWFLGGLCLAKKFIAVGFAQGAVTQTIIAFGGCFFFVSGWSAPVWIVSLKYVIPVGPAAIEAMEVLQKARVDLPFLPPQLDVSMACPFYGITCFMVATLANQLGAFGLPKNNVISLFWGLTFFFMGAWTIGLGALWIPCIANGFTSYTDIYEKQGAAGILDVPMQWKGTHFFQVAGGVFLTIGAIIFTIMDVQALRAERNQDALLKDGARASA